MTTPLYLLGEGQLHDLIRARHALRTDLSEPPLPGSVLLVAHDDWRPQELADLQDYARAHSLRLLPLRLEGALALLGPLVTPHAAGCALCAERRRREVAQVPEADFARPAPAPVPAAALAPLMAVLTELLARPLSDWPAPSQIYAWRWTDLTGGWHTHVPVHDCPHCSPYPDDTAEAATLHLQPRLQSNPDAFREKALDLASGALRTALLDWRYGLIHHVYRAHNAGMPLVGAEFRAPDHRMNESGWGRADAFTDAEPVAFLEALERYGSQRPRGKRTRIRASSRDLGAHAVNLETLGQPAHAAHPAYEYTPLNPDTPTSWVWAHSFKAAAARLIPEHIAYYQHDRVPREERFLYESSNGCALGASVEEATLYGLLEVIERDAFLLAWHTQRPARRIDLGGVRDPLTLHLLRRAESLGFTPYAFDITTEFGVPAIWTLLVNESGGYPRALSAAGAHFNPEKALSAGLIEVVVNAFVHDRKPAHTEEALQAMLRDPTLVRTLDDHVAVNAHPDAFDRLSFLFRDEAPPASLDELFPDWRAWRDPDLTNVLRRLTDRVLAEGLDVLVVDQTGAAVRDLGFAQVKVIVPGSLPMTFGHVNQRFGGLNRLTSVPERLGFPNPAPALHLPHPFP
ncbi:TOMM precursor leader peptide-binding protein [Deinococcus sp. HMF7620]|uniref:TOMM leader peptide-binding protein n=1 Tax=Deinococcus arboris TaxID=2682977 RepID=A0A7C9HRD2_9DEIO|nr:TOMM precursor leader peptide-binding protein [Deinococcus arboris]